jgi:4a-hydroxytetrahydrobiopterin dehydratase
LHQTKSDQISLVFPANIETSPAKVNAAGPRNFAENRRRLCYSSARRQFMAAAKLSDAEIEQKLTALSGWRREGNAISKEFVCDSFSGAASFIAKIVPVADAMDHHPDVQLYRYKRVKIILTTHSAGGLTEKDFDLAAKIDSLAP